jgi:hypothetical protein
MSLPRVLESARVSVPEGSALGRLPLVSLGIGLVAAIASFALGAGERQLWFSWLVAFFFCLTLALGALFFILVHFATKAGWGVAVRRLAEDVAGTLPVLALLFLPLLLGLSELYHWSDPAAVSHDPLLASKAGYLNRGFFLFRAVLYFAVWTALALFYVRGSRRQDDTGDERITRRLTAFAGPALIVFALSVSFASIDWIMSLEPHWYSTVFGVYVFAGCVVSFFSLLVVVSALLGRSGVLRGVITAEHYHDVGKLMFTFIVFWAYIAFAQFFLIWYGNIPEETVWYLRRIDSGWLPVTLLLALGHFVVPFLYLMPRTIKRRTPLLVAGAVWVLFVHLVDIYWLVMPTLHEGGPHVTLLDVTTFVAVFGLFSAAAGWLLTRRPLIPLRDPRLSESVAFENF